MMARRRTRGFTLVELLVVITILGILIALLVPAIWAGVRTANNARVGGEINALAAALASFKNKYGDYPPSRIVLMESGAYNTSAPPSTISDIYGFQGAGDTSTAFNHAVAQQPIGGAALAVGSPPGSLSAAYPQLVQRSMRYLRKFFPRVQVTAGSAAPTSPTNFYDFNGNGVLDTQPILLEGHECLVFFLGGIPRYSGSGALTFEGMSGFSNRPNNPFIPESFPNGTAGDSNRTPPFYDFPADRLIDDDLDGIPGFVDPLGKADQARYYAYFSAYGGGEYDPNDMNLDGSVIEAKVLGRSFRVSFPLGAGDTTRLTQSALPNPYTTGLPVPPGAGAPANFQSNQTFQIISAGLDRDYGPGGQFDAASQGNRLPGDPVVPDSARVAERDNITSFHNGTLD